MVMVGIAAPAFGEAFSVNGVVQAIASGTPQGPALRAYVRNGEIDVLDRCEENYAYVADLADGYITSGQRITDSYYSGKPVTLSIDKDEAGWCRIISVDPTS